MQGGRRRFDFRFWAYSTFTSHRHLSRSGIIVPRANPAAGLGTMRMRISYRFFRKFGIRYARFHPVTAEDCALFTAALAGEHALNGFRNKDLQVRLYAFSAPSESEHCQRSARVTRLLAKLRGHGLISKVKGSRLYRVTEEGTRLMSAAIHCRNKEFPNAIFQTA